VVVSRARSWAVFWSWTRDARAADRQATRRRAAAALGRAGPPSTRLRRWAGWGRWPSWHGGLGVGAGSRGEVALGRAGWVGHARCRSEPGTRGRPGLAAGSGRRRD
jgi:hypothetical protein